MENDLVVHVVKNVGNVLNVQVLTLVRAGRWHRRE
jgi:hypothetical protein